MIRRLCTDGGFDRDAPNRSYEVSYGLSEDDTPSTTVVRAVAAVTGTSPLDLEPLYNAIDSDHLDNFFQNNEKHTVEAELAFTYNGCEVVVTDTEIHVQTVEKDT